LGSVLNLNFEIFGENILYNKLLNDKISSNLGYLYENIVAQMLVCSGNKLFYHTWPTESGKHNFSINKKPLALRQGFLIDGVVRATDGYFS
jgi:hypothetical protein